MAIKRLNDPPTWLKVATTLEKPPTPPSEIAKEFLQNLMALESLLMKKTKFVLTLAKEGSAPLESVTVTWWLTSSLILTGSRPIISHTHVCDLFCSWDNRMELPDKSLPQLADFQYRVGCSQNSVFKVDGHQLMITKGMGLITGRRNGNL